MRRQRQAAIAARIVQLWRAGIAINIIRKSSARLEGPCPWFTPAGRPGPAGSGYFATSAPRGSRQAAPGGPGKQFDG